MTQQIAEIQTISGRPFKEKVAIFGVNYTLLFNWNTVSNSWVLDILDSSGVTQLICGIPLVTGADLLAQYQDITIAAGIQLIIKTIAVGHTPDEIPTFDNLGSDSHLFMLTRS